MVFLLCKHGFTLYWCRNSYFGFLSLHVWLVHLVSNHPCVLGDPSCHHTHGVTYIRWSAYIRANVLLLCLSDAIWQVERRGISYWKSVPSSMWEGLNHLLRQKYHLRYLFYCVLWVFAYFSVILVHFRPGKVRLCWTLVLPCVSIQLL